MFLNSSNDAIEFIISNEISTIKKNVDMFFLVIMGLFVFALQPAFAFYEMGVVRPKNLTSATFFKYISIGLLAYFATGYALSFGNGNAFCGTEYFGLIGLPDDQLALCFFQYTFAAAAATILSGPVQERTSLTAYICYTTLIAGFVYPIATHWAASKNGWLFVLGFDDFAFSGVVHGLGGAASLAAAYMTGPRKDHFLSDGKTICEIPDGSTPLVTFGSYVFIFSIFSFNAGSQMSISHEGDAVAVGKIIMNTVICIASCAITGLLFERFVVQRSANGWNYKGALAGSFVGMVVICAGCNQFRFWGALIIGILSYFVYLGVRKFVVKMKVDDAVDAISIHIGGGYFGLISTSIFKEDGLILNPSLTSAFGLLVNAVGGIVIMLWSFFTICLLYIILRYFNLHRVSASEEQIGLDLSIHKEEAYNYGDFALNKDLVECKIGTARERRLSNRRRNRIEPAMKAWSYQ